MNIYRTITSLFLGFAVASQLAANPYVPITPILFSLGDAIASPNQVGGKEYLSNANGNNETAAGGTSNHQVVMWDGNGGAGDGLDHTAVLTGMTINALDAIANQQDLGFTELENDQAHLVFSISIDYLDITAPKTDNFTTLAPINSSELSHPDIFVEQRQSGAFSLWADAPTDVNGMHANIRVTGLEMNGSEPAAGDAASVLAASDSNKFSAELDSSNGLTVGPSSVINSDGTEYISHATIVTAVETLLGAWDDSNRINIDALMVFDQQGESTDFDAQDRIIFSVTGWGSGPTIYATGAELMVLDG